MLHSFIFWFLFDHDKMFVEYWRHSTNIWSSGKISFCTGLQIYILLFRRVLFIHLEFPWAYYIVKMQIKHFFVQYKLSLLPFTNAEFLTAPSLTSLFVLIYNCVKYFWLRQYKVFRGTSRLRAQITLKLCFIFLRNCDVSFIMS